MGTSRYARVLFSPCLYLSALYLFGVLHWVLFFRAGELSFGACDWPKEEFYLGVLSRALRTGKMPYFIAISEDFAHAFPQFGLATPGSRETYGAFLSIPELSISPQIVLLRWLTPGMFVVANVLFLYSLGFLGSLGIRARYGLSRLPFAAFFLLFNFNGHIVAHLAVGHSMWGGYFLLPFFVLYLLKWVEQPEGRSAPVQIALVLFGLVLQGAVHLLMAGALTVALSAVCSGRLRRTGGFALALAGLLSAVRALPALLLLWHMPSERFLGGYATLSDIFSALVSIRGPEFPVQRGDFGVLGWWEYDAYLGELGTLMLAYFGVWKAWQRPHSEAEIGRSLLLLPLLGVALLALNVVALPLYALKLPFLAAERVTSRLLIVPLLVLLVVACIRLQESLAALEAQRWRHATFGVAVAIESLSLLAHSERWSLAALENTPDLSWHELNGPVEFVQARPSWGEFYRWSLTLGGAVSALVLVYSALLLWRALRQERATRVPSAASLQAIDAPSEVNLA